MNRETDRLLLRKFSENELAKLKNMAPEKVREYLGLESLDHVSKEMERLRYRIIECSEGFVNWYLVEKKSGNVIGDIGFHAWVKKHDRAELGYLLNPSYHGKGYATEAGKSALQYAFTEMKIHRVEAYTASSNLASQNVLKKLGFQHEGLKRDHYKLDTGYSNSEVFGLLKTDFIFH